MALVLPTGNRRTNARRWKLLVNIPCHLFEDAEAIERELRDDVGIVLRVQDFSSREKFLQIVA